MSSAKTILGIVEFHSYGALMSVKRRLSADLDAGFSRKVWVMGVYEEPLDSANPWSRSVTAYRRRWADRRRKTSPLWKWINNPECELEALISCSSCTKRMQKWYSAREWIW